MITVEICVVESGGQQRVLAESITGYGNTRNAAGWAAWLYWQLAWKRCTSEPLPDHEVLFLRVG